MKNNQYCVIMAGGHLNRFWPISREGMPGHFLDISGTGKSLVRMAYERCLGVVPEENILIITLGKFKGIINEQIPELPKENLLLEPYARRTAPCIAYATYTLLKRNPNAVMAATPADIIVNDEQLFKETMTHALDYAEKNPVLVTLGVKPDRPDTEYGYIQAVGGKGACNSGDPVKVKTFTEKPDAEIADVFFRSGEFFWNSGIFVWQASVIKEEMERYIPEITRLFDGWEGALGSPAEEVFIERAYTDCIKLSIDYGVMEKTDRAWVYPIQFGWSDIDSWENYYSSIRSKDQDGNISNTQMKILQNDKRNIILTKNKNKLLMIRGLEDCLVVDTDDVLLICPRDDKQYKELVNSTRMPGYDKYRYKIAEGSQCPPLLFLFALSYIEMKFIQLRLVDGRR